MRSRCVITNVLFRASTHLRVLTGVCWSPLWHAGGRFSGHPFRFLQTTARATCFCFYLFMHIQIFSTLSALTSGFAFATASRPICRKSNTHSCLLACRCVAQYTNPHRHSNPVRPIFLLQL